MALSYIQLYGRSTEQNLNEFNKYSTFAEILYYSNLSKIKLDGIRKIVVELLDKDLYDVVDFSRIGKQPILTIQKSFDFSSFFKNNSLDKKKILIEELHNALQKLSSELKWDETPFNQAYENIIKANFESRVLLGKFKSNKSKTQAGIIVDQDIDKAVISVSFKDAKQNDLKKVEILKTLPQPFIYNQLVSNGRWMNETDFELINNSGEIHIVVSLFKDVPTIFFTPKNREAEGVMEELNFLLQGNLPSWFKFSLLAPQ